MKLYLRNNSITDQGAESLAGVLRASQVFTSYLYLRTFDDRFDHLAFVLLEFALQSSGRPWHTTSRRCPANQYSIHSLCGISECIGITFSSSVYRTSTSKEMTLRTKAVGSWLMPSYKIR